LAQARKRRTRKRARRPAGESRPEPPRAEPTEVAERPRRRSSEERNAEARAELEPLAEGERPTAVTVAAILAATLALANAAFFAAGVEIDGNRPQAGALLFCVVMLAAAWGMWRTRYWAVLGMQALLAVAVILFSMLLLVASNVLAVVISLAVIGGAGTLFWFLVKSLARIQMPERR
jgi:cation transport ATPase